MDKRPKRRKDKYNPYTLEKANGKFYILFTDFNKQEQKIEVSQEIYDCFEEFELNDISAMNEYDRHIEHSELCESTLDRRVLHRGISLDVVVERTQISQAVQRAIDVLPEIQRQRLIKYYFQKKSYKEIAEEEGCKYQCVQRSIYRAKDKLKIILKQLYY